MTKQWLTHTEYLNLGFKCSESDFDKLARLATVQVDIASGNRLLWFPDRISGWVEERVKLAIAYQVEALRESTEAKDAAKQGGNISLGRLSVGGGAVDKSALKGGSGELSAGAYQALQGTGLLYRGDVRI